jgi:hypothetical protein
VGTGETRLRPSGETYGVPTGRWTGSDEAYKRETVKWGRAERESERPIVLLMPRQHKLGGGKGPHLVRVSKGGKGW